MIPLFSDSGPDPQLVWINLITKFISASWGRGLFLHCCLECTAFILPFLISYALEITQKWLCFWQIATLLILNGTLFCNLACWTLGNENNLKINVLNSYGNQMQILSIARVGLLHQSKGILLLISLNRWTQNTHSGDS